MIHGGRRMMEEEKSAPTTPSERRRRRPHDYTAQRHCLWTCEGCHYPKNNGTY